MRTGAEYREVLRDGRKVYVVGEGFIDDLNTHPATAAMAKEYVDWYDRHASPTPEWDVLFTPPDANGNRKPVDMIVPDTAEDLQRMGKAYDETVFFTGGNMTHDPAYGNLIALNIVDAVYRMDLSQKQKDDVVAYRDSIEREGRFITLASGFATIGYRLRENPEERNSLRIVKERDDGLVLQGKIGMHTGSPFLDDVYVSAGCGVIYQGSRATFAVAVNSPGVTILSRKIAAKPSNPFMAPLSYRFDELDAQMWFDEVFVPWEKIFLTEPAPPEPSAPQMFRRDRTTWMLWHQLYCWYTKGEFTLGLALALTDAMGLRQNAPTVEYLVDMIVELQTVRSALTAAELDPDWSSILGKPAPNYQHVASGSIKMLQARQRISEILRILPGSSMVVAPSDEDLANPLMKDGIEESFGGGGYTAEQRMALLNLAWDHIGSALDGREAAFELHCNGGIPAWRSQARARFNDYNRLANGVLRAINIEMPTIDVDSLREVSRLAQRRQVTPPTESKSGENGASGEATAAAAGSSTAEGSTSRS